MKALSAIILMYVILVSGCKDNRGDYKEYQAQDISTRSADSASSDVITSSAAVQNNQDTEHRFVRTADLKFKVKNVVQATSTIENITAKQGGFVTFTNLASTVEGVQDVPVSPDSSLETTLYGVTNSMTLRVPNVHLDSTLKDIAQTVDYLDFRVIRADDVALKLLSGNMLQKRMAMQGARLRGAIDTRRSKVTEAVQAEEAVTGKQERSDSAVLESLALRDQISYSTVTLQIYQRQGVRTEKIPLHTPVTAYTPTLGSRLLTSFRTGFDVLENLLVFFVASWPVLLAGVLAFWLYRSYRRLQLK